MGKFGDSKINLVEIIFCIFFNDRKFNEKKGCNYLFFFLKKYEETVIRFVKFRICLSKYKNLSKVQSKFYTTKRKMI